jgi:hypothetical protein
MHRYLICGTGSASGRRRTRIYQAATEALARDFAEADGTLCDRILKLPPVQVTSRLSLVARAHQIDFPSPTCSEELAQLICLKIWRDTIASSDLQNIASEHGVLVTVYSGRGFLCQSIFAKLASSDNTADLAAWFAYRVYIDLVGSLKNSRVRNPDDPLIRIVARLLATSSEVVQSIKRYEGADLLSFNDWSDSAGIRRKGARRLTLAYVRAAQLLYPFADAEKQERAREAGKAYNADTITSFDSYRACMGSREGPVQFVINSAQKFIFA